MTRLSIFALALFIPCLLASDAFAGPAARAGDPHVCLMVNPGPVPHLGGPVLNGSPNVRIGGLPAARVGDQAGCVGAPDTISQGSKTVLINGKSAATQGSMTLHGGSIVTGFPLVLIGP